MRQIDKKYITSARLLTEQEARNLPEFIRQCKDSWWLCTPCLSLSHAGLVGSDGNIYCDGFWVCYYYGVRPALICDTIEFELGDYCVVNGVEFYAISNNMLFPKGTISKCPFRTDEHCKEMDDNKNNWENDCKPYNHYGTSDVKKFVDELFKKEVLEQE